jgi:LacI family transcriptional regulator
MTTARDVAERAGTSTAVVSYVFNNGPRPVSAATRQRVLDAAEELQYRPNALARALSFGRTNSIGLVVPHIRNPFFAALAEQLEVKAREQQHLMLIGDAGGDPHQEAAHISSFIERKVDGIVLVSLRTQSELESLDTADVPVVALHPLPANLPASTLSIDMAAAAEEATLHLFSHGYRHIGALTGPGDSVGTSDHMAGIQRAAGGAPDARVSHRSCAISRYAAADEAARWLADADRPEAIYCATDEQAFGVLYAAWEAGLSVPRDLAVLGFDSTDDCAVTIPPLSAIRQPLPIMAERAMELLVSGEARERPTRVTLPYELVRRASCGC